MGPSQTDQEIPTGMDKASAPAVTVHPLTPDVENHWDAYVQRHPSGSPYHQLFVRDLLQGVCGQKPHYRVARGADGALRGCLPLVELRSRLFGHFLVSLPYFTFSGPLGDDPGVENALMDDACRLAGELGADHAEIRDTRQHAGPWQVRDDKVNMQLVLPESTDALWKQIGYKLRAQIRRPQKAGATATVGGAELVDDFYRVYARNMRDLGMPGQPRHLFREMARSYPHSHVIVVTVGGRPAAAGFLVGGYGRLDIPWASSLREFNPISVNMLLYWEALRLAVEQGCKTFEFGRSSVDSGTYRFKKQWGARPVPLYWHYWMKDRSEPPGLTPDNAKYRLAIAAWQRLPVAVANVLGPRIIRSLP